MSKSHCTIREENRVISRKLNGHYKRDSLRVLTDISGLIREFYKKKYISEVKIYSSVDLEFF